MQTKQILPGVSPKDVRGQNVLKNVIWFGRTKTRFNVTRSYSESLVKILEAETA